MANEEHVAILKQGVKAWNQWRKKNPTVRPDLGDADLSGAILSMAELGLANLNGADLSGAYLGLANLSGADLRLANLRGAYLNDAYLSRADLSGATLTEANLRLANLRQANLTEAYLREVCLAEADLRESNFTEAKVGWTIFGATDLRETKGLDSVRHEGPSTIGIDTIYASHGQIPEVFLRGAGVSDEFIDYISSFIADQAIQFYSCFISYSSQDEAFVQRLYNNLQSKGVRCWFAPKDMKIGDEIRRSIDQAIRLHDKVLLVLSQHSIASRWVQKEVETAFEQESRHDKPMLFPIRLDDTVMATNQPWAADIRRMKHIGDFTRWKQHDAYQQAFEQLLSALKAEK